MEEKRPGRLVGSKVSQIANIFQNMAPAKEDSMLLVGGARTPESPKLSRKDEGFRDIAKEPMTVTVVRTESHVARFNNARAMFEKLGEENQKVHLRSPGSNATKSFTNHDRRSRSSSANSSDGTSTSPSRNKQISSRSPSPSPRTDNKSIPNGHDSINDNYLAANNKISHKLESPNPKPNCLVKENKGKENERLLGDNTNIIKKNSFSPSIDATKKPEKPEKPEKLEKPEKPERKINYLINNQKNWASHFQAKKTTPKINSETKLNSTEQKGVTPPGFRGFNSRISTDSPSEESKTKLPSPVSPASSVPYAISPSSSMGSSQEEKQEKEVQEKVCLGKLKFSMIN